MQTVQRVVILPREEIGTISPYLHGHFSEHLGELIYPGVWVGLDSPIPNTHGIRDDVVGSLNPLDIPVLRWPGGCFADYYHWRDGIGPRDQRPVRINNLWGMTSEPNQFGTHEFVEFCRLIGAEPYFAGNVGSGSPAELQSWVEYCNFSGGSTLADERRANGHDEPFGIRFWGIGNENWGCGGSMTPEYYASEYCRFRTYVYNYPGTDIHAIAAGPNGPDWAWTRRFMEFIFRTYWSRARQVNSFAAHYYCGTAGTATEYTIDQWFELLAKARAIEGVIRGHRAIMDEYDPDRKINLIVDEWGAWHPVETGKPMRGLYQQNTIRDACVAALSLDVFHNHADKVFMANIAQLINVLQALLLVEEDRCIKTPTYHVFDLYKPHRGGRAVRFVSNAEHVSDGGEQADVCRNCYPDNSRFSLQAVHGSASVKEGVLCVTACNTHPTESIELDLAVVDGRLGEVEVVELAAADIHDHNAFDNPDCVTLSAPRTVRVDGDARRIDMKPGSVVRILGSLI